MKTIIKRNLHILFVLIFTSFIFAQNERVEAAKLVKPGPNSLKTGTFIDVNSASYTQTSLTIDQLIKNVLISGGNSVCSTANVSNVQVSPNLAPTNNNRSWGYFNKGTTAFPFSDGVILTTGYARKAGNTYNSAILSDALSTSGDVDLAAALNTSNSNLYDATYIEFDFVPTASQIKFNYIFASEEYFQTFPCSYTDGFALLIKKVGDPTYTNLAVLPNGNAVSVTSIRPSTQFSGLNLSCGAQNPTYFAGYNTGNIETNFNGRTIPLTATATVIPGQTYHFKMVLADFSDTSYDSGVFLQAGSFNIGISFTDSTNNPLSSSIAICEGASQTIVANVQTAGATYQWYNGTTPIFGATSNTYTVTQAGSYTVQVLVPGTICPTTATITVTNLPSPTVQNTTLNLCSPNATATFNLTAAQPTISTTSGATFTYYANLADATAGNTNNIPNPTNYSSGNATIYVLVKVGNCSKIAQIQLSVTQIQTPTITSTGTQICGTGSVVLTSSSATGNTWSTGETTQSITVTSPGTYTVSVTNGICTSTPTSFSITGDADPNLQITGDLLLCQPSTILTATSNSLTSTYVWSTGATTPSITVTTAGTYTVTLTGPNGCQFTKTVVVTQGDIPVVQNSNLTICSTASTATFNLTTAQPNISTTPGVTFIFYQNLADAYAGNANNITNITNYISGNTTIYVLVKTATCFRVAELVLTVTSVPTAIITSSSATICIGGTVTLTSNSLTGNTWSTGQTTQSITVNSAGTYTLSYATGNCVSTTASYSVANEPDPAIVITGDLVLCQASSVLTASSTGANNTYSWSTGSTTANTTITVAGTYTVTVTTAAGCQFSKSVTVTQGNIPVVQNASLSVCSTATTANFDLTTAQPNISTTTGTTFTYYQNLADANAGNANFINNPAIYNSGNAILYVLVKTSTCFRVAELQLVVSAIPVAIISSSAQAICDGSSVTLTSNYPSGNTWSNGQTTQSITVSTAGTYTLINTVGNCVSSPASITLQTSPNPNIQITGNLNFCQSASTTLTATATGTGNTFLWNNGTVGAINTVNAGGLQTVTVTTALGCSYQKSVTTVADPTIVIHIATPGQINCNNPTITLNATNSVYQPGSTISWVASNGGTIVSGGNTLTPIVNTGGTYTLTITSTTQNGCSTQGSVVVIKDITPPVITVTASNLSVCLGDSVTLTASGAQTYTWIGLPGTGSTQTVSPNITTTYSVTGIGSNGCVSANPATITITVVPAITSILHNDKVCKGEKLVLDAGSGPNYTYLWNTGETTQMITVDLAGTYTVTISNSVCSKIFTSIVTYKELPQVQSVFYQNTNLIINATISTGQALEYSIDGGVTWQDANVFTNVLSNVGIDIFVRAKGETCYTVYNYYTFLLPNAFTPNKDGINDVIDFSNIVNFDAFKGEIFDRFGTLIFKIDKQNPIWDGTISGRILPTASYWYLLQWIDINSKQPILKNGWILLKTRP